METLKLVGRDIICTISGEGEGEFALGYSAVLQSFMCSKTQLVLSLLKTPTWAMAEVACMRPIAGSDPGVAHTLFQHAQKCHHQHHTYRQAFGTLPTA